MGLAVGAVGEDDGIPVGAVGIPVIVGTDEGVAVGIVGLSDGAGLGAGLELGKLEG